VGGSISLPWCQQCEYQRPWQSKSFITNGVDIILANSYFITNGVNFGFCNTSELQTIAVVVTARRSGRQRQPTMVPAERLSTATAIKILSPTVSTSSLQTLILSRTVSTLVSQHLRTANNHSGDSKKKWEAASAYHPASRARSINDCGKQQVEKRYNQQSTGGSHENTTAKPALTAAAEDEVATTPDDVSLMNGQGTCRTMMMPRFHPACQTAEAWEWMAIPWQISFWRH